MGGTEAVEREASFIRFTHCHSEGRRGHKKDFSSTLSTRTSFPKKNKKEMRLEMPEPVNGIGKKDTSFPHRPDCSTGILEYAKTLMNAAPIYLMFY